MWRAMGKAIELKPDMADAWHNRANALKDLGILDDAISSYEEAVSLRSDFAEAHRSLSALKTFEANDQQMEIMERTLAHGELSDAARTEILFALAKACEDLGEYDRGFEYLEQGNRLRKNALHFDIEEDRNLFARIKEMADGDVGTAAVPEAAPVTPPVHRRHDAVGNIARRTDPGESQRCSRRGRTGDDEPVDRPETVFHGYRRGAGRLPGSAVGS